MTRLAQKLAGKIERQAKSPILEAQESILIRSSVFPKSLPTDC